METALLKERYIKEMPDGRVADTFKRYKAYKNKYIVENYIRNIYFNTVMAVFDTLEDMLDYIDEHELEDIVYFEIGEDGTAYYPEY